MFNLSFWKMSLERALKTAAQAVLLAVGASSGLDLFSLDWLGVLGAAAAGGQIPQHRGKRAPQPGPGRTGTG